MPEMGPLVIGQVQQPHRWQFTGYKCLGAANTPDVGHPGVTAGPVPCFGVIHHLRPHHKGFGFAMQPVLDGVDRCRAHIASLF